MTWNARRFINVVWSMIVDAEMTDVQEKRELALLGVDETVTPEEKLRETWGTSVTAARGQSSFMGMLDGR